MGEACEPTPRPNPANGNTVSGETHLLRELERVEPEVESLGLRDRYSARERNLHELVFYEGVIDVNDVEFELEKAKKYVEDVRRLLGV